MDPRRLIKPGVFVLVLFGLLYWRLPSDAPDETPPLSVLVSGSAFGTTYAVKAGLPSASEVLEAESAIEQLVEAVVDEVNASMSTYHPSSELSRFNRAASTNTATVSEALGVVLKEAARVHAESEGAFDPTVGPLVNAWGFGPDEVVKPPTDEVLAEAKTRVGWGLLELGPGTLRKSRPDVSVDLSAIAKGYAVAEVSRRLTRAGFNHHLVEIGGEVAARGQGPAGPWRVGIERPERGGQKKVYEVVSLTNLSLATSGNYRNFVTVGGRSVTHIIDPRDGGPVGHGLGSVSVLDPDCMRADALATALYVLGERRGRAWAESHGVPALFLTVTASGDMKRVTSSKWPQQESKP